MLDRPVYEFRPLEGVLRGAVRRYADGEWIEDDGEYDLAFIASVGAPICLFVSLPYERNIEWSWLTAHWTVPQPLHPRGDPWHYSLREGETKWGGDWGSRQHPNALAGDSGMRALSSQHGCSNGFHVDFDLADRTLKEGLFRDRDTKEVVTIPESPSCMYCGADWIDRPVVDATDRAVQVVVPG